MSTTNDRPLWADLTMSSTREEVAAALAEHDAREAEFARLKKYTDEDFDWRGDPPDKRDGCYWTKDGNAVACYRGGFKENPVLARQRLAGEEDQSRPGWDQGA